MVLHRWEQFRSLVDERESKVLRAYTALQVNDAGQLDASTIKGAWHTHDRHAWQHKLLPQLVSQVCSLLLDLHASCCSIQQALLLIACIDLLHGLHIRYHRASSTTAVSKKACSALAVATHQTAHSSVIGYHNNCIAVKVT